MSRLQMWTLAAVAVFAFAVAGSMATAQTDPGRVQGPTPIPGVKHNPFPVAYAAPDGGVVQGRGTATGAGKFVFDGMCVSVEGCIRVSATNVNDGGTATVTAGQWYMVKAKNTGGDGCMRRGGAVTSCDLAGRYPIEAGERWREAWGSDQAAGYDGGSSTSSVLYFLATSATAMVVTLCPVVPCQ